MKTQGVMGQARRNGSPVDLEDDVAVTLDRLAGEWWIYQLRDGHRYSTDDVLTAWTAACAAAGALHVLDLGGGVGSVGLMTLLRLSPAARLTVVEVQSVSVRLLRKTLQCNGITERVDVKEADLRDAAVLSGSPCFDLIAANPPYLPPGTSSRSPHPQRAGARIELHGDVFDYCRVAARHLAPGGRFCFCHRAGDGRPEEAVAQAGMRVVGRRQIVFREGRPPTLALFTCAREAGRKFAEQPPLVLRDRHGRRTEAYRSVRRAMLIEE